MIASAALGFFFTAIIGPRILGLMIEAKAVMENYQRVSVVKLGGLIIVSGVLLSYSFLAATDNLYYSQEHLVLLVGIVVMALIGLIDDMLGDNRVKGLRGHMKSLIKGQLTTGGLKALGGAAVSLFLVLPLVQNFGQLIIYWLTVALAINAINLLDLRPGRALKSYILILFTLIAYGLYVGTNINHIHLMLLGSTIAFWPYDLGEKAMLGDTGANVLGLSVGYAAVVLLPFGALIGVFLILIALHGIAERKSLTKIIEEVPLLRFFDNLGRC
ncbi:hypothetical protein GGQ84_001058 [Desulfitispora alkaliphila]|uniref:hypothetical protein n=1 Tax=Desulfitispora alkaliphila TaxID=622674 RepID=UPI003D252036